jgi:hypothetical protein
MEWAKRRRAPLLPKGNFTLNNKIKADDDTDSLGEYRAYVTIADMNEERGQQVAQELSPFVP